ncbi:hypothetical protein AV530_009068 [Patagioenas fasciata monilis]|uniref:Uncharacterized protein n=1 Tax=Patagioenas fasciata monilis TaxID=372326 RepID=A0A1V4J7L6_PATFA|nr:hypothetical protein AV530_009068 [Patagioenas fasciata monilis]
MLAQRQWGRCRHSSFSPGEQTRLSSHFLPNRVAFADSYPQKAFCGVFDPNGDAFVSACQGEALSGGAPGQSQRGADPAEPIGARRAGKTPALPRRGAKR